MEYNMLLYELGKGRKHQKDGNINNELQLFSFDTIATATNCFSSTNKLGEGGFGSVYKVQFLLYTIICLLTLFIISSK